MDELYLIYVLIYGVLAVLNGLAEYFLPQKTLDFWLRWSSNRYYRLHGIFLILTGLPLTAAEGTMSWPVIITGIFVALTGPFVIIYPEKFKKNYNIILEEKGIEGAKKLVIFDSVLKVSAGAVCILHFLLNLPKSA